MVNAIAKVVVFLAGALLLPPRTFAAAPATGPLRVHPQNPRYFTDGSTNTAGALRVVYLTGSHTWANLIDRGPTDPPLAFDFDWYLNFLVEHHHNFIRLWGRQVSCYHDYGEGELHAAPLAWSRTGPGNALDGKPKFDLTRLNQGYFDRLRARVMAARDRGIYVGVMLFGGSYECHGGWLGNPFHAQNNINGINGDPASDAAGLESHTLEVPAITRLQEAYVRKLIDTVNDLDNVLYEISNEGEDSSKDWQYHLIRFIQACEAAKPKQHPVGMTAIGSGDAASNRTLAASPAEWISPHTDAWGGVGHVPAAAGGKVSVLDSDHWFVLQLYKDPALGSEWVWKAFCRGHHPILMEHLPPESMRLKDCPLSLDDPGYIASRRAMGQTRRLAERMTLAAMTPRVDLASSGCCLANPGVEYVVYAPGGAEITVDLTPVPGALAVEWLHPVEARMTPGATIQGGAKRSLRAPFAGDAVLHLQLLGSTASSLAATSRAELPYDRDCPVVYDNDYANDYVDWYLMSLASAGEIRYRGISTSSSVAAYNRHMPAGALDECVALRTKIVATARASGMRQIPEPVTGTRGHLIKPASGKVEDTRPLDSPGSRQIVREAKAASADRPLVVCVGGPLTVVADAYLLDESIADKLIVAWLDNYQDGMYGFNGWSDGWAAYIVLEKLRLVQFTVESNAFASVPKNRLRNELPGTPMREFLLGIKPDVVAPAGDADGPPAISIMRQDYVLELKRVSFGGWKTADGHEVPMFKDDAKGRALVVTKADAGIATEEWWRALKNPALWGPKP